MEALTKQGNWKVWQGFVLQAVCIFLLIKAGAAMQFYWGMAGLAATEIMYLLIALGVAFMKKTPLKEVFPVKKISFLEFLGFCFFFAGGFLLNMVAAGISFMIFPDSAQEVQGLNDFMAGTHPLLLILIVAVLPAICEEAIERGAVLSHLRSIKKDWVIVLIMGCFFGLFHLSFVRFLNTACMGAILTYMVVKKNNILYSVMFHFLNNFISACATILTADQDLSDSLNGMDMSVIAPIYLILGFAAPLLLVLGNMFMCPKAFRKRQWIYAGSFSFVLLVLGIGLMAINVHKIGTENTVINSDFNYVIEESDRYKQYSFEIEEDGSYVVTVGGTLTQGTAELTVLDPYGEVVASDEGSSFLMTNGVYDLEKGTYILVVDCDEDAVGGSININMRIGK